MQRVQEPPAPEPPLPSLPNLTTSAPAGSLSRYVKQWERITSNSLVLKIVKEGYKIQLVSSIDLPSPIISNPRDPVKLRALTGEIEKHLENGVISPIEFSANQYVSRVFTVQKPSGDFRMIIDLKNLNNFVNKIHFRMENKETIQNLLAKNDYMVSIDLRDAFFTIPLHEESKKYAVFQFKDQRFQYNVLPFGLTSSPRIFTKIMKPIMAHCRSLGIKISHYLDDLFICGNTLEKVLNQRNLVLSLLCNLGFSINIKKSCLSPTKNLIHLGFQFDSVNMTTSLPGEKVEKINRFSKFLLKNSNCTLRDLASFLGLVVNAHEGFLYAPLHYRHLQFLFISLLRKYKDWEIVICLNDKSKEELNWWRLCKLEDLIPRSIVPSLPQLTLTTDASLTGWGGFLSSGETISGTWKNPDDHINVLELEAVHLCILHFLPKVEGKSLEILSDNNTCVHYINNMGGTHSYDLCSLALKLWKVFEERKVTVSAKHIPGKLNVQADFYSRFSDNHEYSLSPSAFSQLCNMLSVTPEVDLFASKYNAKLQKYVSLDLDQNALSRDAFSIFWPKSVYMFPPIPLIARCVRKFIDEHIQFGILITPAWPALPMIPEIISLLRGNPVFIPSSLIQGTLPTRHAFNAMAWPISGCAAEKKVCQLRQKMPSSRALHLDPSNPIVGCGASLLAGLAKEGIIVQCLSQ